MTTQGSKKEKLLHYIVVEQPQMLISRKQAAQVQAEWLKQRHYYRVVGPEMVDVFIRADSPYAQWRAYGLHKEQHFFEWVNNHLKTGDVVYDVGANVGVMAMTAARLKHGTIEVHAFEPVPSSFGQLQENCVFNGLKDIRCWPIALFDEDGSIEMNLDSYQSGSSLHDVMSEEHGIKNPSWAISFRADSLPEKLSINPPDHMKIDVDGMEREVLRGMEGLLKGKKLRTVLMEVDKNFEEEVRASFSEHGFKVEGEWIHKKVDGTWDAKDTLFVRS